MRRWMGVLVVLVSCTGAAWAAETKRTKGHGDWPETRAGRLARGWVEAFAAGDPAMRAFLQKHLAEESLAKRGMDQRMTTYRESRERFGKLTFASVVKSTPEELTVTLLDSDLKSREYIFAVQTEPPFKLISVSRKDVHSRFRHGFGGHN